MLSVSYALCLYADLSLCEVSGMLSVSYFEYPVRSVSMQGVNNYAECRSAERLYVERRGAASKP